MPLDWFTACAESPDNADCEAVYVGIGKHQSAMCKHCGEFMDDHYDEEEELYGFVAYSD